MKKAILLSIIAVFTAVFVASANPVDVNVARNVGAKFLSANAKVQLRGNDLQLAKTYNINRGDAAFYVFNAPNGFVIVAGDDCAYPILGYSDNGRQFDINNIPIQLQDVLQEYQDQIQYAIENNLVADEKTAEQWQLVKATGKLNNNRDNTQVGPLLTTTWDQGQYYNAMCPADENGPDGHCVTGCVATAMAQIIKYHGYPASGRGIHSYQSNYGELSVNFEESEYDYDNMSDELTSNSTQEEVDAVAKLMYDCGVAVNMMYSTGESGAYDIEARTALINFFKYSENVSYALKSYFSNSEWDNMLRNDISANRPVMYSGSGISGGHLFICDGYKQDNFFHFNFGWSSNGDGWYLTSIINPGTMEFNIGQAAIFGIAPDATENVYIGQVSGRSTLIVDEPIDIYHILGHNLYYVNEQYGCENVVTLVSSNESQSLVLDIINHEDQNIDIYDGYDMTTLVRQISATSTTNDYSPIVSSGNALTLKYTFNIYSKFPVNGFLLRVSNDGDCRMVSNIVTSVDNSTVHLSWNENGDSPEWQVEYGVKGFSHGNGTIINTSTNILDIVMPNKFTEYDFYIRPVCGTEEYGPWSPAVCVMTLAPYWTDIVTEQPDGYVVDSEGSITISSAEALVWLTKVSNGLIGEGAYDQFQGKSIVLESDVDMSAYRWLPIGSSNISFWGEFDGQGHTIDNIFIKENDGVGSVGFFASMCDHAIVKNLYLKNIYVYGGYYTGGLVGNSSCSSNGEIMNCMVQGRIIGGSRTGGIVGDGLFDITNCFSICDVSGDYLVGNIAGCLNHSNVKNCYSVGKVTFNHSGIGSWIGDIIGYPGYSHVSNCYSLFDFHSVSSLFGYNDASTIEDNSYFFTYENSYFNSQNGPATLLTPVPFDDVSYSDLLEVLNKGVESINIEGLKTWIADSGQINGGLPLFGDEYIVTCPNVSDIFARNINVGGENAVELSWTENGDAENWQIRYGKQADAIMQVCDTMFVISTDSNPKILLGLETGSTYLFYVRPVCDETYKGGWSEVYSHVVDKPYWTDIVTSKPSGYSTDSDGNVSISTAEGLAWFISVVNGVNGQIGDNLFEKRVILNQDIDISQYKWTSINNFTGVFDGKNHVIDGLYVNELSDNQGFFGSVGNCSIMNVYLDNANVIGQQSVGSLCGESNNVSIVNCCSNGVVSGQLYIGGLVGTANYCFVDKCYSMCDVTAASYSSGGIVGRTIGGLYIRNCNVSGNVRALGYNAGGGGLIGYCDALVDDVNVSNCFANVTVNAFSYCGGFIGSVRGMYGYGVNLNNCYSAGEVYAPDLYQHTLKASFIGHTYGKVYVNQCYAEEGQNVTLLGEHEGDTIDFRVLNSGFYNYNNSVCTLQNPIVIGETSYTALDDVLNGWVSETADSNYLTWMVDTTGYPVFGPAFVETCPYTEVMIDTVWVDGASIIWSKNEATAWELEYGIQGFCHGDGVLMALNDTLMSLSELITGTSYDVYVRVICDNETHSRWSDVLTVRPDKKYWKDIVTSQPEGYLKDGNGNVFISSAEGMAWLISVCNGLNGEVEDYFIDRSVHLLCDVDLSEYKWSQIQYFQGIFDGHNHLVSGLIIHPNDEGESYNSYMFSFCNSIYNTVFYNCDIKGKYPAIIRELYGELKNCGFTGDIVADMFAAGVVEYNHGNINNCYSNVNVTGEFELAGFASNNYGNITNCYASGRILSINGQPNCGQFSVNDYNPSNDNLIYWLLDGYNYENGLFGSYANQNPDGYVSYSGTSVEWSLNSPVNIGGQSFNTLLSALNAWVDANNTSGEYLHWVADTNNENGGFPMLERLPATTAQIASLTNGWNWWSTYIEQEGIDGLTMLENALGANGENIKSQSVFVKRRANGTWMGQLTSLTNEDGYKISVTSDCTVAMLGAAADPGEHPITIKPNWTWIGYPLDVQQTVSVALSGFEPVVGDIIKGAGGFAKYRTTGWMPSNFMLEPGKSYMYSSGATENKTLVYSDSRSNMKAETEEPHWQTNRYAYADNLTMIAVVKIEGEEQRDCTTEVGAFVNGECRGSARLMYDAETDRYLAMLTISGEDGDVIDFGVTNGGSQMLGSETRIRFTENAMIGDFTSPKEIRFGEMTDQSITVYPNPVEKDMPISLTLPTDDDVTEIVITDMLGVVVSHEIANGKEITGISKPGVYMIRTVCKSGKVYNTRIIVK